MLRQLKTIGRAVAPAPVKAAWGSLYGELKVHRARAAYARDPVATRPYLDRRILPRLIGRGYRPPDPIRYDAEGLALRADDKLARLQARVPLDVLNVCVELGCWDGMVLAALARGGRAAYGIDVTRAGFDRRAHESGARLVQSDAAWLPFAASSVDLVYSFAAFEHFREPAAVVGEAARVLRPGGYLYLLFGPVYTSPYGLHAYRQIAVPYCHYLFTDHDLRQYAADNGLPAAWPYVNGVTVTQYRRIFAAHCDVLDAMYYREHPTGGVGAELIAEYPGCFKGKVPDFDDLLVSGIEVCLRRR